jgi:hypothetical protein
MEWFNGVYGAQITDFNEFRLEQVFSSQMMGACSWCQMPNVIGLFEVTFPQAEPN